MDGNGLVAFPGLRIETWGTPLLCELELRKCNRRSIDYDWRKTRANLRSG
jgi:hypothetical protein